MRTQRPYAYQGSRSRRDLRETVGISSAIVEVGKKEVVPSHFFEFLLDDLGALKEVGPSMNAFPEDL